MTVRALAVFLTLLALAACARNPETASSERVPPWEGMDKGFSGCEGG